jgi:hypothetical protein
MYASVWHIFYKTKIKTITNTLVRSEGIFEVKIMISIFFFHILEVCFLPKKTEKYSSVSGTKSVDLTQRSLDLRASH